MPVRLSDYLVNAVPSKLYEYLTMDHPIVFGGKGEPAEFLRQFSKIPEHRLQDNTPRHLMGLVKINRKIFQFFGMV